jgi:shikimate kinase/3-dehydroquinate dehydratase
MTPVLDLVSLIDVRLQPSIRAQVEQQRTRRLDGLPRAWSVVLVGHRAAGKTSALASVAQRLGRKAFDLDRQIEKQWGRPIRQWVAEDEPAFRAAERACFKSLPHGVVIAVGGGFLSKHGDLLQHCVPVLVPVSFETYCERLRDDTSRPRLSPELTLSEELRQVYESREAAHARVATMSFAEFAARAEKPQRPLRVVTAPRGAEVISFAAKAKQFGADLLELRTDLTPSDIDIRAIAQILPLLVSERKAALPRTWTDVAAFVDLERPNPPGIESWHASSPQPSADVMRFFGERAAVGLIKYVEPFETVAQFRSLLRLQAELQEKYGAECVTVLATGAAALPVRAVLARRNAFDYLALDESSSAAPGQRLLADAVREARHAPRDWRLGILGQAIAHSRSPRIHRQPFDRIDLPADADFSEYLSALLPFYSGLAVTSPFKSAVARCVGGKLDAVNTLVRHQDRWHAFNTDVDGAEAVLKTLNAPLVTVLGDGGATVALRLAAQKLSLELRVLQWRAVDAPIASPCIVTWPTSVALPERLRFENVPVAVIAYGTPARKLSARLTERGALVRRLGARWFIAQARAQKKLWESAT